jgi:hypothetical protein
MIIDEKGEHLSQKIYVSLNVLKRTKSLLLDVSEGTIDFDTICTMVW